MKGFKKVKDLRILSGDIRKVEKQLAECIEWRNNVEVVSTNYSVDWEFGNGETYVMVVSFDKWIEEDVIN